MMIVQTFMKEKKKGGRGMSYMESNKEKTVNCVRRGLRPSVHEEQGCFPIGLTDPKMGSFPFLYWKHRKGTFKSLTQLMPFLQVIKVPFPIDEVHSIVLGEGFSGE